MQKSNLTKKYLCDPLFLGWWANPRSKINPYWNL